MSQYRLAKVANVSQSYLGKVERGFVSPGVEIALRLAEALQTDVASLFGVRKRNVA